jgi:hypothetical protein
MRRSPQHRREAYYLGQSQSVAVGEIHEKAPSPTASLRSWSPVLVCSCGSTRERGIAVALVVILSWQELGPKAQRDASIHPFKLTFPPRLSFPSEPVVVIDFLNELVVQYSGFVTRDLCSDSLLFNISDHKHTHTHTHTHTYTHTYTYQSVAHVQEFPLPATTTIILCCLPTA